jgi:Alpha/beta hydrolase family
MAELPFPGEGCDVYGSAPPRYVLVHGVGGDRTQWRAVAQYLATDAGVLAVDLAGHCAARDLTGPYRISRCAADIAQIASRRVPAGAVLIGHSMGAAVCLRSRECSFAPPGGADYRFMGRPVLRRPVRPDDAQLRSSDDAEHRAPRPRRFGGIAAQVAT